MKIRFRSPHQASVDAIDHGLTFERDEIKDVPDAVGLSLLENSNFSRAYAAEEAAAPAPAPEPPAEPVSAVTEQPA